MKKTFKTTLIIGLMLISHSQISKAQLVLKVSNIKVIEGTILYGLYNDPSVFLEDFKQFKTEAIKVETSTQLLYIDSIPAGVYAVSLFHDIDSDNKIAKNFFGIPKEPYGFSQNLKPMFKAPSFEDAKFEYDGVYKEIEIRLLD